jgi:hypothetical protein
MTLISFVGKKKVRKKIDESFPFEKIKFKEKIKVLPNNRNQLIGIAFDYLLRCFIEFHNKNTISTSRRLISPKFNKKQIRAMHSRLAKSERYDNGRKKYARCDIEVINNIKFKISMAEDSIRFSKYHTTSYEEFEKTGKFTKEFLISAIIMAQWELILKSPGFTHPSLLNFKRPEDVDVETINELQALTGLPKSKMFTSKKSIHLNPEFGIGSDLVGGAAADLIIDDTLIDIKTISTLEFSITHYRQLIGYWILSKIGKINQTEKVQINNIGIYFARHGILKIIPVSQFENLPSFSDFINWFEDYALDIKTAPGRLRYKCAKKADKLTKSFQKFSKKYDELIKNEKWSANSYCINYFKIKKEKKGFYQTHNGKTSNSFKKKTDAIKKGIELQNGHYWIEIIYRNSSSWYLVGIVHPSGKVYRASTLCDIQDDYDISVIGNWRRSVSNHLYSTGHDDEEILQNSDLDQLKPINGYISYW